MKKPYDSGELLLLAVVVVLVVAAVGTVIYMVLAAPRV
jgi:flagellar basal body-associated protein FliL